MRRQSAHRGDAIEYGDELTVTLEARTAGVEPLRIFQRVETVDTEEQPPLVKTWPLVEQIIRGYVGQNLLTLARVREGDIAPVPDMDKPGFDEELKKFFQHPAAAKP